MADYYIGEIVCAAFNFAPTDFLPCDGRLIQIASNTALFSVLGTNFGGDGKSTFALPDLRGVTPIGAGQGPGLPLYNIGEKVGAETETLTSQQLPAHTHGLRVSPAAATSDNPGDRVFAASSPAGNDFAPASAAGTVPMAPTMVQPSGGAQPHDNMQPTLAVHYFICVSGFFPPRP